MSIWQVWQPKNHLHYIFRFIIFKIFHFSNHNWWNKSWVYETKRLESYIGNCRNERNGKNKGFARFRGYMKNIFKAYKMNVAAYTICNKLLSKRADWTDFRVIHPKICANWAFTEKFITEKLGEISVVYAVNFYIWLVKLVFFT